jgi:hypothetical protein
LQRSFQSLSLEFDAHIIKVANILYFELFNAYKSTAYLIYRSIKGIKTLSFTPFKESYFNITFFFYPSFLKTGIAAF